jgi:hypothetical protein
MNKRMMGKQTIIFIIVIAVAVYISTQVADGQTVYNETAKRMVDKLKQDTKKE